MIADDGDVPEPVTASSTVRGPLRSKNARAFWIAYVLTRPLGAALGDGLSQPRADGGLGLGTTWTSVLFLVTILAVVAYLAVTKRDQTPVPAAEVARVNV